MTQFISEQLVINIHGVEYKVEYKHMDGQGEAFFDDRVIYLNPSVHKEFQKVTLLHEILHISMTQKFQYNVDAASRITDAELREHLIIDPIANVLYDILRDNLKLREWLFNV